VVTLMIWFGVNVASQPGVADRRASRAAERHSVGKTGFNSCDFSLFDLQPFEERFGRIARPSSIHW